MTCEYCKYKDSCRWTCILLSNIYEIKKIKESDFVLIKRRR